MVGFVAAHASSSPPIRTLTEQELTDMLVGSAIYCSRGSDTEGMINRMRNALRGGRTFRMVSLQDFPDDWMAFTSSGIGGGGGWEHVAERYEAQGIKPYDSYTLSPEKVLSDYLGKEFKAIFPLEAGEALAFALATASRIGLPIIDADPTGRCIPEVQMSPFYFNKGIGRAPLAGVTKYGDEFIVPKTRDDFRAEDLLRGMSVASNGSVLAAMNALAGSVIKENLIPGFLTQSMRLGRAAREALAAGQDPVQAVVQAGGGYLLFRGKVTRAETRGEKGFGWSEAYLEGTGDFSDSDYRIYNKNENLVGWRDGKVNVAAPDVIAALDPKTGWAMLRHGPFVGSFKEGEELAIVGFPAHALWRTARSIQGFGPRYFGFDFDYVPIERYHGGSGGAN